MYRKQWHECGECGKKLSSSHSLWRHKKKCQPHRFDGNVGCITTRQKRRADRMYDCLSPQFGKAVSRSPSPPVKKQRTKEGIIGYSDDESVKSEPIDTYKRAKLMSLVDKIADRPVLPSPPPHVVAEVFRKSLIPAKTNDIENKTDENKENLDATASKGKGLYLKGRGLDDESDSDGSEQGDNACEKEKEKALRQLVNARIRKPKRKLKKLMTTLEEDGVDISHLEELVGDFLASEEKEINQELYDALGKLKTSSKTIETEMMLKEIEKENYRIKTILRRLDQADPLVLPSILEAMKREELINEKLYQTLVEKPYSILEIIGLLKEPKIGRGVIQFLPGSPNEMIDKLALLIGEYTSGNTTVKEQIKALLEKMFETDILMYHEYKALCEKLGICPRV